MLEQDKNWNINQEERDNYNKFSKQIKQSHIHLGADGNGGFKTTHKEDYDKKSVDMARV